VKLGLFLLRTITGGLFFGHGMQKLAGWFGGYGLDATAKGFHGMGLRPGKAHAVAAGAAEAGGGLLLALGLDTPFAAMLISGTMATAIRKVHLPNGVWAAQGGYEFNLALMAIVFAIADVGPGDWSLDAARGHVHRGPAWALAQLVGGLIGSTAAIELGSRFPDDASPAEGEAASSAGSEAAGTEATTATA